MARTRLKFNPGETPTTYSSPANAANGVVVADGPVKVIRVTVYNANASTRYFQLFNTTSVPAESTVPDACPLSIPTLTTSSIDYGANRPHGGKLFTTGLCWSSSTTAATKTAAAASDLFVEIEYL